MKEVIRIDKAGETYDLHVMWAIHHKCNYACSYCPSELHDGEMSHLNLDSLKEFIDHLHNHYVNKLGFRNLLFSFTGGEPTLWKDFRKFLEYVADKNIRLGITTNGSVGLNFWKGISSYFDYICLSYHSENAHDERFLATFEYLHNDKDTVVPSVRFVMHTEKELWDKSINMIEQIKKFPNWTYECVHLLEDYGTMPRKTDLYSLENEKFLENNAFKSQFLENEYVKMPKTSFNYKAVYSDGSEVRLDENKLINDNNVQFYGWKCDIGLEQLLISPTGDVLSAGCPVGVKKWHGNVYKSKAVVFPTNGVLCTVKEGCFCPTDIRISKRKI